MSLFRFLGAKVESLQSTNGKWPEGELYSYTVYTCCIHHDLIPLSYYTSVYVFSWKAQISSLVPLAQSLEG